VAYAGWEGVYVGLGGYTCIARAFPHLIKVALTTTMNTSILHIQIWLPFCVLNVTDTYKLDRE
jgi:hypothetical protein